MTVKVWHLTTPCNGLTKSNNKQWRLAWNCESMEAAVARVEAEKEKNVLARRREYKFEVVK